MPYLIVLALAAAVGVAVYAITLRSGTHPSVVESGQTATAPAARRPETSDPWIELVSRWSPHT